MTPNADTADRMAEAIRLMRSGQHVQSAALARDVLAHSPGHGEALHLLGILTVMARRFGEGLDLVNQAIATSPGRSDFWNTKGLAQRQMKDTDGAATSLHRALDLDPSALDTRLNLIDCLHKLTRYDEAARLCPDLQGAAANNPQVNLVLGNQLMGEGRSTDAIDAFRRCVALAPGYGFGQFRLATAYVADQQSDQAIAAFEAAVALEPHKPNYAYHLAIELLNIAQADKALGVCNQGLDKSPADMRLLSAKAFALQLAGKAEEADRFLAWDRLVQTRHLAPPSGFKTLQTFNTSLRAHIEAHPSLTAAPAGNATQHGDHTGEILVEPKGPLGGFETLVEDAVNDYAADIDDLADHPLVQCRPKRFKLTAWSVLMRSGGHQLPHIHPSGWLSGVYYVALPSAVAAHDPSHDGWIEFGRPGPLIRQYDHLSIREIQPKEGLLVLFPSYLYHRTIPFHNDQKRISIAFDALPVTEAS